MKHTFSGSCRGGPLDGQSLVYHQNVYRIFEPPSYELLGQYLASRWPVGVAPIK